MFNKWIFGGICFLIVFVVACVLWYQWTTAPYRQEAADAEKLLRQWELSQETDTGSEVEQVTDTPAESSAQSVEKPITKTPTVVLESDANIGETAYLVSDSMQKVKVVEKRRVSPHGFGPYPEVPSSFVEALGIPIWQQDEEKYFKSTMKSRRNFELMHRVLIKLWNEGDQDVLGATFENGKVYPTYRDVIYLTEKIETGPDGIIRVHRSGLSGQPVQLFPVKVIPEGMRIIDRETGGIDPYQFLNLNQ